MFLREKFLLLYLLFRHSHQRTISLRALVLLVRFPHVTSHIKDGMEFCLTKTSRTFLRGFGSRTKIGGRSKPYAPRNKEPEAYPLYYTARGGREMTLMHAAASGGHIAVITRTWR